MMAKQKKTTSSKKFLDDNQLRRVEAFYHKLELSRRDIDLHKSKLDQLKIKRAAADLQLKLLSEQIVNAAQSIQALEEKFKAKSTQERDSFLAGIAEELGIDGAIKGFDPETGEVDF
jgi:hypothetical protein